MTINAWPFLISRNQYLDYRTIVAPDFICKAKITKLLTRVVDANLTEPKSLIVRQIQGSKAGNFTVAFRVIKATEQDINNEKDKKKILKDQFGREIYLIEGLVFKEMHNLFVTDEDLNKLHQQVIKEYSLFWNYVDPPSVICSQEFTLKNDPTNSLKLIEIESFQVVKEFNPPGKFKPVRNLIILLASVATGLFLITWIVEVIFPKNSLTDRIVTVNEKFMKEKHIYANITIVPDGNYSKKYLIIDTGNFGFVVTDGKSIYKISFSDDESAKIKKNVSFTLNDKKKAKETLDKFKHKYPNTAIFLTGELKEKSSNDKVNMDYSPICQAISEFGNRNLSGKLNATIIESYPKDLHREKIVECK